ncbi:site-specific DNA-methyltransferase [Herbiconiux sp. CPCC 205716]|uniref:Methyltransferase n=1 Tax=Herbiconiux gentiana TaxID=2970912 RepID=A0ABT2GKA0_9MICO|nr:site-specific DNA-methyltransferase [Herbiconiux gentiana]MCS5716027.1 site-specific DNA-methyltransferase [Herbiconiux gentiana]
MPVAGSPLDDFDDDARGEGLVIQGDNLPLIGAFADGSFTLIYLDPPFNTGRSQARRTTTVKRVPLPSASVGHPDVAVAADTPAAATGAPPAEPAPVAEVEPVPGRYAGFKGRLYDRIKGDLLQYDDRFDDYWSFLEPRLVEAWRLLADDGTLYLHLDYREAHYAKVLLDALFGRECFLNEIIWAYDYGAKSKNRWPTKHDTILVYVKNPATYYFDSETVDREPYMAPGLVTPERAARGKLPTDVWWHTIVSPTGREKTGYPTQKPEGVLRRIVQASSREGDWVLDFFAGSGTTGAVAAALGRNYVLVDQNEAAIDVIRRRLPGARFEAGTAAP